MPRHMTTEQAREANAARTTRAGGPGRKPKPSKCRKCGSECESRRAADAHCVGARSGKSKEEAMPAPEGGYAVRYGIVKARAFAIKNADGLFLCGLAPVNWHSDLGLAYKYNVELIAGDVARQLGAEVVPLMVPLAPKDAI